MDQVFDCAAPEYELASMEGEHSATIIVPSFEPGVIAAALAHAWNEHIPSKEKAAVWSWSDPGLPGTGYERGYLLEQGELGQLLVFHLCMSWDCGVTMTFTIEQ